ncbi:Transposable element P transposase [Frankliniella fusca]|uniref:Transposable element P transposase n=1 Tax=Frankliniella fusca TaxID=407009 RepID=A0AAE1I3N7_9NEOP|nr:Transposable element P transposase [Frankliniella fusca]
MLKKVQGLVTIKVHGHLESRADYQRGMEIVKHLLVVNDCAEQGVRLFKDFNKTVTKKEESLQDLVDCLILHDRLRKVEDRKEKLLKRKREAEEKKQKLKYKAQSLTRSKLNLIEKAQQEAVKACFAGSKRKGPSGRRYTAEWIYECMLMRIKDKKLYYHIRDNEILVLPAVSTINGYLKHYGGAYGFQPQVLLNFKYVISNITFILSTGMILIDEMKLTKGVYFDASTLQVLGFEDLGGVAEEALGDDFMETVEEAIENLPIDTNAKAKINRREKAQQKHKKEKDRNLGDHALVISFQPFRGKWVQAIACFLTKGNATDTELTKLILEAVILLEQSGLLVDGVVTDGASWNRSMWTKFGVTKENCSATHPCDPSRKLFFISDFPHLMKCKRNCLCTKKIIKTPKGDVKLQHWEAILQAESLHKIGLKECHKLTPDHLHPDPWQKMNVAMAWQFWSTSAAAAMESYRLQGVDELEDCDASLEMCFLINNLADAMNSNRPENALRLDSAHFKAIEKFLEYFINLKTWADTKLNTKLVEAERARVAHLEGQGKRARGRPIKYQEDYIFSDSTDIGLIVSLKGTLELVKFLIEKCEFKFVMTARLNQDALEQHHWWRNGHYTLFSLDDLKEKTKQERQKLLSDKLDEIIRKGQKLDHITELMEVVEKDHDYIGDGENIDEFALSYVTGFVARHSRRYTEGCETATSCGQPRTTRGHWAPAPADLAINFPEREAMVHRLDVGLYQLQAFHARQPDEEDICPICRDDLRPRRVADGPQDDQPLSRDQRRRLHKRMAQQRRPDLPVRSGARLVLLPACGHYYHHHCIRTHLGVNGDSATCPVCRGPARQAVPVDGLLPPEKLHVGAARRRLTECNWLQAGLHCPKMAHCHYNHVREGRLEQWEDPELLALIHGAAQPDRPPSPLAPAQLPPAILDAESWDDEDTGFSFTWQHRPSRGGRRYLRPSGTPAGYIPVLVRAKGEVTYMNPRVVD